MRCAQRRHDRDANGARVSCPRAGDGGALGGSAPFGRPERCRCGRGPTRRRDGSRPTRSGRGAPRPPIVSSRRCASPSEAGSRQESRRSSTHWSVGASPRRRRASARRSSPGTATASATRAVVGRDGSSWTVVPAADGSLPTDLGARAEEIDRVEVMVTRGTARASDDRRHAGTLLAQRRVFRRDPARARRARRRIPRCRGPGRCPRVPHAPSGRHRSGVPRGVPRGVSRVDALGRQRRRRALAHRPPLSPARAGGSVAGRRTVSQSAPRDTCDVRSAP